METKGDVTEGKTSVKAKITTKNFQNISERLTHKGLSKKQQQTGNK